MLAITTTLERIGHWTKMRQCLVRFSGPESSPQTRSLADFIATTSGFRFFGTHRFQKEAAKAEALREAKPKTVDAEFDAIAEEMKTWVSRLNQSSNFGCKLRHVAA
jgi:hypothetical protein